MEKVDEIETALVHLRESVFYIEHLCQGSGILRSLPVAIEEDLGLLRDQASDLAAILTNLDHVPLKLAKLRLLAEDVGTPEAAAVLDQWGRSYLANPIQREFRIILESIEQLLVYLKEREQMRS